MAVKVKLQKKKPAPVKFAVTDFAHPDERRARLTGLGIGVGAIIVILGLAALMPYRVQLTAAWAAWAVLAAVYYAVAGERREQRELVNDARRSKRTPPDEIVDMARKQTRLVGVAAHVVAAGAETELTAVGDTLVVPEGLRERLSPGEVWAVIARHVGHLKAGHVRLRNLCRRVNREERVLARVLALPLRALARGLANWRWYAEMTADRLALVLTRDRKVLAAALLKEAIVGAEGITTADIDEYLKRHGSLAAQSAEVTTHFRLGEVLRAREDLMYRLRAIGQYAESEEYKQACDKLDAGQRKDSEAPAGGSKASDKDAPGAPI